METGSRRLLSGSHTGIDGIIEKLLCHVKVTKGGNLKMSMQFSTLKTNAERVGFAYRLLDEYDLLPVLVKDHRKYNIKSTIFSMVKDQKNNERALRMRKMGNDMFREKNYDKAIEFYTQSILLAENGSECLALAYANRSAVLFETGFYQETLMDINRAFENNYPENLKPKVLARQQKATNLKKNQKPFIYFQPVPRIPDNHRNKFIQSAADCVEIKYTKDKGRGVFATRDISVGEILAVEEPFCTILTQKLYNHCHNCLKLCYNLIPCTNCTHVMFCNDDCKEKADPYHKYECSILETIKILEVDTLRLVPLKIALIMRDQYISIKKIKHAVEREEKFYRSDRYEEIHNLTSNTSKRSVSDLFDRAATAAILYHLIKKFTNFFQSEEEHATFKELVLLHMQILGCNSYEIGELAESCRKNYEPHEIGSGVYSFASLFNHRCSPNVVRSCHGTAAVFRCAETIKKGEQCFGNYGFHHGDKAKFERNTRLKRRYFFDCTCDVCLNDWPLCSYLPRINFNVDINYNNVMKLYDADVKAATTFLAETIPKMKVLESVKPNQILFDVQQALDQCYSILGNVRRPL